LKIYETEPLERHDNCTFPFADSHLINEIFITTQRLYFRLKQANKNIDAIIASIRQWSHEPLHQRSVYGKNLLEIRHQQERVRLRLIQSNNTKALINRSLISNFCLLFNYPEPSNENISTLHEVSSTTVFLFAN